jgi:ATP-dependent RNA helicase RhlE
LENIKQIAYDAVNFNTKVNLLKHLLQENEDMSRVLIFVNNKKISDMLHGRIDEDFEDQFGVIHSNKSQNYRLSDGFLPGRNPRTYYYRHYGQGFRYF